VAIALPRFFTRLLDTERFAAWSLILQIAAYASYLDFGLQTAIARFVAEAIELEHKERQEKLISTALILLSLAALIAFAIISIVIWQFPHLFGGIPLGLLPEFRHAALLLSLSACLLLPLSTYSGVLIGMHRNEIPALATGGSRIAGCVVAILVGHFTQSLPWLALCIGGPNVLGGLLQLAAVHRVLAEGKAGLRHVSRVIGIELMRFSGGLTVWSFGMLLVSGLDVTIVGHFRFSSVGSYSIASMLISFFAGMTNAALSALMAPLAALHARDETRRILRVVFTATQTTLLANLLLIAAVFLFGEAVLRFWVGPVYAESALPILKVLAVAQTVRLTVAPYTVMLVSVGDPEKAVPAAICEALVNLTASIAGAMVLGPIGVAWGTMAGATCGVLWILLRIMPSLGVVRVGMRELLVEALLPGSIPCLPLAIFCLIERHLTPLTYGTGLGICVPAAALLAGRFIRQSFKQIALV
jgi:O-antigen/teichoic acid export membrane protein